MMSLSSQAGRLVLLAITGQAIAYVLSIVMARRLSLAGFEAYAIASAIFILLATMAPLGAEKYTLRQMPALLRRADWGLARGFLHFGLRRTLLTATAAAVVVALWTSLVDSRDPEIARAILVTCLSLPAGALVHYGLELLSAAGRPVRALAIFRVLVPATALLLAALCFLFGIPVTGPTAIGFWGLAWVVALVVMALSLRRAVDPRLFTAPPSDDRQTWRRESRPFFIYRASLSLLAQAGIIALELLGPEKSAVGAYAAAMATVGMATVLATATNRAYGREMALLLESGDFTTLLRRRRARLAWLAPALALFLLITFVFSAQVLALFRPEFAVAGVVPLRILAATTAFTVLFALAPTYLKFRKRNRTIYTIVGIAAAAQIVLLILLVPGLGATGAAIAYAVSMCGLYGSFAILAHRDVLAGQSAALPTNPR